MDKKYNGWEIGDLVSGAGVLSGKTHIGGIVDLQSWAHDEVTIRNSNGADIWVLPQTLRHVLPTTLAAEDETNAKAENVISNPGHYTSHPSGIEPIQLTRHMGFLDGNVIKYVMRAPYKGSEIEDLYKAQQYLTWLIEKREDEILNHP